MKRVSVLFVIAVVVLGISSVVHAEVIWSQNFDGAAFVLGNTLDATGVGDSTTTEGLWKKGPVSSSYYGSGPTVVNDYAHSGDQSMYLTRGSSGAKELEGYTTYAGTPLNSGIFESSVWLRRGNSGSATVILSNETAFATTVAITCSALHVYDSVLRYSGPAKDAWVVVAGVTLPENAWFGLKMVPDLDNNVYDVWYNSGAGWTEVVSDADLKSAYINNRNVDCFIVHPQSPSGGQIWIDDCGLQIIPEPSTLALLATGLIGLLCYAWRKRK